MFDVASNALHSLKVDRQPQTILISGLTGSGKTESTKGILDKLCQTNSSTMAMAQNVLATNPILESFGNAKTEDNFNSSRFCKFIKVGV